MNEIQQRIEHGESITIAMVIESLRPGAVWAVSGNVYSGLEWRDDVHEKPTEQEVIDEVERLNLVKEQLQYRNHRKIEYPSIGDQLDALYKARNGDTSELEAIDGLIANVKVKYPKSQ